MSGALSICMCLVCVNREPLSPFSLFRHIFSIHDSQSPSMRACHGGSRWASPKTRSHSPCLRACVRPSPFIVSSRNICVCMRAAKSSTFIPVLPDFFNPYYCGCSCCVRDAYSSRSPVQQSRSAGWICSSGEYHVASRLILCVAVDFKTHGVYFGCRMTGIEGVVRAPSPHRTITICTNFLPPTNVEYHYISRILGSIYCVWGGEPSDPFFQMSIVHSKNESAPRLALQNCHDNINISKDVSIGRVTLEL